MNGLKNEKEGLKAIDSLLTFTYEYITNVFIATYGLVDRCERVFVYLLNHS